MQTVLQIIIAILVFCVIIVIHELGHFIAAKLCKIQVNEFALGMGPEIFRKRGKNTDFVIRALPIGGFCAMEGEDGTSDNPHAFNRRPIWQRMIVILAGAFMNLVLGYFVIMISLCSASAMASTTISSFRDQPMSNTQLMVDDEILSIDGMPIFTATDISYKLQNSDTKSADGNLVFDIVVMRNGERLALNDVEFMTKSNDDGSSSVYFDFYVYRLEKNFGTVVTESFKEGLSTGRLIIMSLIDMVRGRYGLNDLSGPVGVITVVSQSVSYGFSTFMSLVSMITINVGVFNLLPIPALDGCRFLFLLIEAIRRKPVKPEHEGMVHFIGFAVLMLFMVVVTFSDVFKLIAGG